MKLGLFDHMQKHDNPAHSYVDLYRSHLEGRVARFEPKVLRTERSESAEAVRLMDREFVTPPRRLMSAMRG